MFTFGDFDHELDNLSISEMADQIFSKNMKTNAQMKSNDVSNDISNFTIIEPNKQSNNWEIFPYFGLTNIENCCFLNSVLQILINNPEFKETIKHYQTRLSGESDSLNILIKYIQNLGESKILSDSNLIKQSIYYYGTDIYIANPCLELLSQLGFTRNEHQDAEEFLTMLFTTVHEDLLKCDFPSSLTNGNTHSVEDDDIWLEIGKGGRNLGVPREDGGEMTDSSSISEWFGGKIIDKLMKRGREQNSTLTPFFILPLNIQSKQIIDVESALIGFTQSEQVDNIAAIERQLLINKLPQNFVIQLKRFTFTKNIGIEKIQKQIQLNQILNIPKKCVHKASIDMSIQHQYKLSAVIFHIGAGVYKGHYTAAIQHSDDSSWIYFDDNKLYRVHGPAAINWLFHDSSPKIPETLLTVDISGSSPLLSSRSYHKPTCVSGQRTAYLLFYRRI